MTANKDEAVIITDHRIPMPDGAELATRIWCPVAAEHTPVPAVLEYIPYRLRDGRAIRDHQTHRFLADHGYAGVRVDIRGSGDSDGILTDEYLQSELDDGLEVLRWIADQPWSDGRVALFGISWGGFNGLQLAALQPPELHAVITVCSSDDRYADDVHYMGGCLLTDNLSWGGVMTAYNAMPPDPSAVGDLWRAMWHERLKGSGIWTAKWLRHQRRDTYWRHGSVCEDYGAIRCPVLAVSGWADGYCNTVFRLVRHLEAPAQGLVGPWNHKFPHLGGPGPSIDFLGLSLRWLDRWLCGIDNGIDTEPALRAWIQDSVSPFSDDRPGRWVAEPAWPGPGINTRRAALGPGRIQLDGQPDTAAAEAIRSPLTVGLFAGKWCSYSEGTDLPGDQRMEDGGSLVYDSEPLEDDFEILGAPLAELELSADRTQAMVAVRLTDVAPDGKATLVTYGLLNLAHRDSHADPEPLEPGRRYQVRVALNHIGQCFPAGHRLRVSISSSYWPLAWPSPEPATLTIYTAGSCVELPERTPSEQDAELDDLGEPRMAPSPEITLLGMPNHEWSVTFNLATNESTLRVIDDDAPYRLESTGTTITNEVTECYAMDHDDNATLRAEVFNQRSLSRPGWAVTATTHTVLTATPAAFRVRATVDAWEGNTRVFSSEWDESIPRDNL